MLNKFKQRARDMQTLSSLMIAATSNAATNGSNNAGAHHLLLAAVTLEDDESGREAFVNLGADPDQLESAIEEALGAGVPGIEMPDANSERSATEVKVDATFDAAIQATHGFHNADGGVRPLRTAHVVAGVASIEHGLAARALAAMGIDTDALVAAASGN